MQTNEYPWRDRFWAWAYRHGTGLGTVIAVQVLEVLLVAYGWVGLHRLYPNYNPPSILVLALMLGFTALLFGTQGWLARDLTRFRGDKPW